MSRRLETRLAELRERGRRGLAPYVAAGDGGLDVTLAVMTALDAAGAACIELGVPFSDPIADGPVLQQAAQRALEAGATLEKILEMLAEFRAESDLPVVLMGYANSFLRRSWRGAARAIADAGGDGLLVADLPVEEGDEMASEAIGAGIAPIFFASPTSSDERIERAARASRGFLYAVGRTGVTGRPTEQGQDFQRFLARVKEHCGGLPLAVGFGIAGPEQVAAAVRHADLAIVGSALVAHVHQAVSDWHAAATDRPGVAAHAARGFTLRLMEGLPP